MQSGKLRHRVTIQQQSDMQDDYGQTIQSWSDVATVWANVADVSGREFFGAQSTQNAVQTKISIRHRSDVRPAMRVVHGSDVYNIEAVLDQGGRRIELMLMCSKGLIDA